MPEKRENLYSFGKASIGMTSNQFNLLFSENLKDTLLPSLRYSIGEYTQAFKELDVDKNITLKQVTVQFNDGKLCRIECDYNKTLFDKLCKLDSRQFMVGENHVATRICNDSTEMALIYNFKHIKLWIVNSTGCCPPKRTNANSR